MKKTLGKVIATILTVMNLLIPQFKKEDSTKGIKEFLEFIVMINTIAIFLCKRFKDGVQFGDFGAFTDKLMNDDEFKAILKNGYDKASEIKEEIKDADAGEWLELAKIQVGFIPQYVGAFAEDKAKEIK